MLLRAATPLSLLLLAAFVLLLLSTLTTPIIKGIPLATDRGLSFGVFGYCNSDGTNCVGPQVGYNTDQVFGGGDGDFSLASGRNTLFHILIIHPIAAFLTLVCLILALASHFHAPANSARFLLALLILTIPTILASLLAFLVDILLFVPRLAWGGWIVLAATILIVMSSVLSCAMRRTLISRKARTKRIAENDEMNGTTYYENLNRDRIMADDLPRADSPPPINADKTGTQYATFETKSHDSGARTSEDRTPLNPALRAASVRSGSTGHARPYDAQEDLPPMPIGARSDYDGRSMSPRRPSRDEYGNPLPSDMGPPVLRHSGSRGSLRSNGSGRGMPYNRGRGYGPPPRGYGPPRGGYGPPRGRGGYGPPRGGFRGGPPPPGWNGRGGPRSLPPRGPSPNDYGPDPYYFTARGPAPPSDYRPPPPIEDSFVARGPSPGPGAGIGQAIEMDERTGSSPSHQYAQQSYDDGHNSISPVRTNSGHNFANHGGMYPDDGGYVSPRAAWKPSPPPNAPSRFSPDNTSSHYSSGRAIPLSPIQASPNSAQHTRGGSENYYEDVDPRFAVNEPGSEQYQSIIQEHQHPATMPSSLMPGNGYANNASRMTTPPLDNTLLQPPPQSFRSNHNRRMSTDRSNSNSSVDEHQHDTRSPDGSENSHFTSISQRPVNPHWRPGYSGGGSGSSAVAARRRKEDIILNGNPDFSLPGAGIGRGKGRGGAPSANLSPGLTPPGRYPTEI